MVAHISLPNVIGDDTPCSLSKKMMTDILRNELKYDGIIITDAINMGAIADHYSDGEASANAFAAGADMILMPTNLQEAYDGIYAAYEKGEITEERIDESLRRIIAAKLQ
jgi:beta-N-acetylhexosaminidase